MVVNRALLFLLPQEEHQNPCLQVLVSDILSEMIFHNGICGKACESWLLWEGITKIVYAVRPDLMPPPQQADSPQLDRLSQFGLLSASDDASQRPVPRSRRSHIDTLTNGFWALLQSVWLAWLLMRSFVTALIQASSLPVRSNSTYGSKDKDPSKVVNGVEERDGLGPTSHDLHHPRPASRKQPILDMAVWGILLKLTRLQDRMPWLTGSLSLTQWLLLVGPGQVCCTDSRLDR